MATFTNYVEIQGTNLQNYNISFLQSQISNAVVQNIKTSQNSNPVVNTTITFQQPIVNLPNGQQLAVIVSSIQVPDNINPPIQQISFLTNGQIYIGFSQYNWTQQSIVINFTIVKDFGSTPVRLYQITVLSSGQPVQGATVTANLIGSNNSTNSTNISVRVFTTDSTGSVYIVTPSKFFSVSISAAGYVTQTQNITQPQTQITIAPTPLNTNNMLPIIGVAVGGLLLLMMAGGGGGED